MNRFFQQLFRHTGQRLRRWGQALVDQAAPSERLAPLAPEVEPPALDAKALWLQRVAQVPAWAWQGRRSTPPRSSLQPAGKVAQFSPLRPAAQGAQEAAPNAAPPPRQTPPLPIAQGQAKQPHLERTDDPLYRWLESAGLSRFESAQLFNHPRDASVVPAWRNAAPSTSALDSGLTTQPAHDAALSASQATTPWPEAPVNEAHPGATVWNLDDHSAFKSKLNLLRHPLPTYLPNSAAQPTPTLTPTPEPPPSTRERQPKGANESTAQTTAAPQPTKPLWQRAGAVPVQPNFWPAWPYAPQRLCAVPPPAQAQAAPPSPWPELPLWPDPQAEDVLETERATQQRLQRLEREQAQTQDQER
jgi:hypothetical protein